MAKNRAGGFEYPQKKHSRLSKMCQGQKPILLS